MQVNVGRGTPWACAYHPGPQGTRAECERRYANELYVRVRAGDLALEDLAALHDAELLDGKPLQVEVLSRAALWATGEVAKQQAARRVKRDFRAVSAFRGWAEREGILQAPRVLVCGRRGWEAADIVAEKIGELPPGTVVIEGEAPGADVTAAEAAVQRGLPVAGFPASWDVKPHTPRNRVAYSQRGGRAYDRAAGFIRNELMVKCEPDRVLAFTDDPETGGTADTIRRARANGIAVEVVYPDGRSEVLAPLEAETVVGA